MTTKADIRAWLANAPPDTTHMIVVCDTFDHSDYPVYVPPETKIADKLREYDAERNMQRVMEVYDMTIDLEAQLDQQRAYNL